MTNLQKKLSQVFPELEFQFDFSLAPLTYLKVGGPAEAFISLAEKEDIVQLIRFCRQQNIKLTLLGGASNVIVEDKGVSGLVLQIEYDKVWDTGKTTSEILSNRPVELHLLRAGAGCKTALLVSKTVTMGFTGLEYFLGVPGRLGGAVYNNSHYLSDLIGEHITRVQVINASGELEWLTQEECDFGYDHSRFHRTKEAIIEVEFALAKGNAEISRELIKTATQYRATTQPLGPASSGCIFRNVPNTPALQKLFPQFAEKSHVPGGFLIDQAGLKSERVGGVHVSEKHAAWFINDGDATSQDVKELVKRVKNKVKSSFNVDLQEEVFYLE